MIINVDNLYYIINNNIGNEYFMIKSLLLLLLALALIVITLKCIHIFETLNYKILKHYNFKNSVMFPLHCIALPVHT